MNMVTIVSCGILECELKKVVNTLTIPVKIIFLPPSLHLNPFQLKKELQHVLEAIEDSKKYVVYGKCCKDMDELCKEYDAERIEGETCYDIVAGERFFQLLKEDPGTYFLLPGLCEDFDHLTQDLSLERTKHILFENYNRCVFLDTGMGSDEKCRKIAKRLGLPYERIYVGVENLEKRLKTLLKWCEHQ